jgi:hypothetical protein
MIPETTRLPLVSGGLTHITIGIRPKFRASVALQADIVI